MADICVIYVSEDESIVEHLVSLLRKYWEVWWARDITHGDWEDAVRTEIPKSLAVVPVMSQYAKGRRKSIIRDEMRLADRNNKPIFPFLIADNEEMPLGFDGLNRTEALGWQGNELDLGYQQLRSKIEATIGNSRTPPRSLERAKELALPNKTLRLPSFVFSLSSHETQVTPKDGATLLQLLEPDATLVSAYDAWKYYGRDRAFGSVVKKMSQSSSAFFLDSGNYEAYRKSDRHSPKKNPEGWHRDNFRETATRLSPDLAFSFDTIAPTGKPDQIVERIARDFRADDQALKERNFPLCPIIHLPGKIDGNPNDCAAQIISGVAAELQPLMLAVPERELGDGLLERIRTVLEIRKALNALGKYYPLHLLGTGNPLSMVALAAAGADSFDGLEWCRTVADYANGSLFHFQQFDFFCQMHLHRIQDPRIRHLIEAQDVPYRVKTLGYNVDFFKDWTRTMQNMIHSGQTETLLKMVPHIGPQIFKEISL